MKKRFCSFLFAVCLVFALCPPARAAQSASLDTVVSDTAAFLQSGTPATGYVGGDWAALGLARSACSVPDAWFQRYCAAIKAAVSSCNGVLSEKKFTEYSRVVLALTAVGADPKNVAGHDLLAPLGDYDKTVWQGVNGPVWALLALDAKNDAMPRNSAAKTQATRQMYVNAILSVQNADGGWAISGAASDVDLSAMALQALAKYSAQTAVQSAIDRALAFLSATQNEDGGFSTGGSATTESAAQVTIALCELGIPLTDARFVKNGASPLDALMSRRVSGGGFCHIAGGSADEMATEQAFLALVAAQRAQSGKNTLYRMADAVSLGTLQSGAGLPNKNAAVQAVPVKKAVTFADVAGHENQDAIETLAARGIINGKSETSFDPNADMTRAEFAAITVRALGLTPQANGKFADVSSGAWYAPYIGTANRFGIVNGVSGTAFNPAGTITRQEAAVMTARAAALCGMDTALDADAVRNTLAPFSDYTLSDVWAREGLAFCCNSGILDAGALTLRPKEAVLRCEVAQMLANLLQTANLI